MGEFGLESFSESVWSKSEGGGGIGEEEEGLGDEAMGDEAMGTEDQE